MMCLEKTFILRVENEQGKILDRVLGYLYKSLELVFEKSFENPKDEEREALLFDKIPASSFVLSYLSCPSEMTAILFAIIILQSLTVEAPTITLGWESKALEWEELAVRMHNMRHQDFLVLYTLVKAKVTLVDEEELAGSVHRLLFNGLMYPLAGREIESPTSIASYMVPSPYGIYICMVINKFGLFG